MRNLILSAVLVSASLFGMTAQAADVPLEAGKTYVELANPVPVAEPGKIEVVELFWYGCPHCYAFEPTINPWVEKLPSDVHFVRIPAMFGGPWDAHGQLFLTLEAMGVEHKVHAAVFNAIQKEGKRLTDKNDMADFVATQGVDKEKFLQTFDSFAIKGQIVKARELAKKYEVSGVPTLIVNGKYRFDLGTAGGPEQALNVADQLIAKERAAEKAAPQAAKN
ncbi:thiol:disulfide interchange protein DsbA [Pseudomonas sp. 7P_10.2_Bac1]|uniref:thiol:disulfide interchange protein DsbA n=1 Tax=Pseudomonas sp. 7P_10.2_Bac1 TaxID=2971614 RepID=UPI0021CA8872|nr:thiol:disulfide interchange protein DsbA [Pseudomonas sp. 7P_10.2_Bac1]MCU1725482.1 thiol:disulfide interchange protein DsbA [Pseudomonas sp. 7P_10.2_Bac1]